MDAANDCVQFLLISQDEADMNIIVTALKQALAPYGWVEAVRRYARPPAAMSASELG